MQTNSNSRPTINATRDHLSDKLLFLIYCCQTERSEDDINFILSYLDTEHLELNALISLANQHGILPLVYKAIKTLLQNDSSNSSTKILLTMIKPHYLSTVHNNMSMSADLLKILSLFKENHIKALSFKGPSLAEMAYGDITLRQFGDLDILIHKKDIQKIEVLCRSMGYTPYLSLTDVQKEIWYTYTKDMVFYHPEKKSYIEMHWLLLDADFPLQINLDSIWEHTDTVEINKHPIQTFSSDALLLYLCIHGSKHLWERMVWIKDIDLMIQTQSIDWENIIVDAKKNNLQRMLFLGLYLSEKLFNTPLPNSILKALEDEKVLPELSDFVFENWGTPQSMFPNTRSMLKFFPTVKLKARYLHKTILKPSRNEYKVIDLPKGLHWVYYLVRPYLLLKKYLKIN